MIPFRYGDYAAIRRTYLPADYRRDTRAVQRRQDGLRRSRVGPARSHRRDALGARDGRAQGLPNAMVAQAWLDRDDAARGAGRSRPRSRWSGAYATSRSRRHGRRTRGAARRARWTARDGGQGFALLARHRLHFDLQTPWWHFDAAAELARDFPATTIIVNHTGLPADRSAEGLAGWRRAMELLAREPNVVLKISGLGVPGQRWTAELQGPVVRDAIAHLRGRASDVRLQLSGRFAGWPPSTRSTAASWKSRAICRTTCAAGCSTTTRRASIACSGPNALRPPAFAGAGPSRQTSYPRPTAGPPR